LVLHHASLLGAVTHAANHHPTQAFRKDGTSFTKLVRDVTGPSSLRKKPKSTTLATSAPTDATAEAAAPAQATSVAPACSSGPAVVNTSVVPLGASLLNTSVVPSVALCWPVPERGTQPLAEAQLLCRRAAAHRRKREAELVSEQLASRVSELGSALRPGVVHEPGLGPLDIVLRRIRARFS
jgi:hypothetical protein